MKDSSKYFQITALRNYTRPVFCNSFKFTVKQNVLLEWIYQVQHWTYLAVCAQSYFLFLASSGNLENS